MLNTAASTTHFDPFLNGEDRSEVWSQGVSFEAFLPTAEKNADVWSSTWKRAKVSAALAERADALTGSWRLLVISSDWCGDAANSIPPLARLAERTDGLELRMVELEEQPELMDAHLTGGTARAIPVVILLDASGKERAWWGSRPTDLQAWVKTAGMEMESEDRYKEVRKWYARDKGQTTLREVIEMIETASGGSVIG